MRKKLCGLLVVAAILGCGLSTPERDTSRSLIDGYHAPDVLTEIRELPPPPSTDGNRFVSGWWPYGRRGPYNLVPLESGARIEIVSLESRQRGLQLKVHIFEAPEGSKVVMTVPGFDPVEAPLEKRTVFPLPETLPAGRIPIDLKFSPEAKVTIQGVRLVPNHPAGEVRFGEEVIAQEPWSIVDFVQRVEPDSLLTGEFYPPAQPGEGAEFTLVLQRDGGEDQTVFAWPGDTSTGPRFEVDLGEESGLFRFRLVAKGQGGAARWKDLSLSWPGSEPDAIQPPKAPRLVILYILDALRADHLGAYGGERWPTPTLDRIAAEGVTFVSHMSNAPNTKPSLKNLFGGRSVFLEGHIMLADEGVTTLAEGFRDAGFRTAAFSGSPWVADVFGTDQGFQHHMKSARYKEGPENVNAAKVHALTLQWLDKEFGEGERGFVYMHTMHPHNPYDPPEEVRESFVEGIESQIEGDTRTLLEIRKGRLETSAEDQDRLKALYASGLAYNDQQLDGFLEALKARFEPDEVLMIVTSDHGEELFEHGGVLHGYTLYEDQLHVPLIFWWPGQLEPARIETGTDHLDLHATLMSLATEALPADTEGESLWGLLAGKDRVGKPIRFAAASSVKGGIFMARTERYKLVWAPRGGRDFGMGIGKGRSYDMEYVFDLQEDPGEMTNLVGASGLEIAWLRSRLLAWIERGKLMESGAGDLEQMNDELREELEALGYLD